MKKMDLMPTDENILQTLQDDMFKRNEKIGYFMQLLDSIEGSYTIAIDGQWGSGKTFFLKQSKLVLEAYNPNIDKIDTATRQIVKDKMKAYIGKNGLQPQYPIYYDAWTNDNDEDPIVSLMYSITEAYHYFSERKIETWKGLTTAATEFVKMVGGADLEKFQKLFESESCMDDKKKSADLCIQINVFLEHLNLEKGNRLVLFIDELDRCKPTFAVKFLERIKHYFEHPNITFVFSVNMAELANTIQNYYGEGFDAGRYLNRFFDYTFHLPDASMDDYYYNQGIDNGRLLAAEILPNDYYVDQEIKNINSFYDEIVKAIIKVLRLELREIIKFLGICKAPRKEIINISNKKDTFIERETALYCAVFILPMLLGIQNAEPDRYNDFITGKYPEVFVSVLVEVLEGQPVNPFQSTENNNSQAKLVYGSDSVQNIYEALFSQANYGQECNIEGLTINDRVRHWVLDTASGLSSLFDFKIDG